MRKEHQPDHWNSTNTVILQAHFDSSAGQVRVVLEIGEALRFARARYHVVSYLTGPARFPWSGRLTANGLTQGESGS